MRRDSREALKHLRKARDLSKQTPSPLKGLTFDQAIERMRKVREEVWEEKFAAGARHK
jgi:hypothetical protein